MLLFPDPPDPGAGDPKLLEDEDDDAPLKNACSLVFAGVATCSGLCSIIIPGGGDSLSLLADDDDEDPNTFETGLKGNEEPPPLGLSRVLVDADGVSGAEGDMFGQEEYRPRMKR